MIPTLIDFVLLVLWLLMLNIWKFLESQKIICAERVKDTPPNIANDQK